MHIAYIDCMNYANLCFLVSLVICPFSLPSAFLLLSIQKVSCLECRVEYFHILYFVLIFGAMGITWRRGRRRISGAPPIECAGKYTLSEKPAVLDMSKNIL